MAKATVLCPTEKLDTLTNTPGAAVAVDDIVVINTRICVAYADVAAGAKGEFIHRAEEIEAPKAAVAITEGDTAYWDSAANVFTNVVGLNTKCGMFLESALAGDATARLRLDNSVAV